MKKWQTLSSRTVFSHPRMTLQEDAVLLPDGNKTTYLKISGAVDASGIIAIRSDGKILVQKEYSYPPNEHLLQLPGGGFEKGDTPAIAAARELAEEAGLQGKLEQLGWFYVDNRRKDSRFYIFTATALKSVDKNPDDNEWFEDYWYTPDEINELIRNGDIVTYSFLAAWSMFQAHKNL